MYPDVEFYKNKLLNFHLYIIMDTDDCTAEQRRRFINKDMFKKHWLYDYIIPIYNSPNLESTMKKIDMPVENKKDYITIFPINNTTSTNNDDINELCNKLERCDKKITNIGKYFKACLDISKENRVL